MVLFSSYHLPLQDDYMDLLSKVTGLITDEALASKYAADMVHPLSVIDYAGASADWDLRTNMTDYNQERSVSSVS